MAYKIHGFCRTLSRYIVLRLQDLLRFRYLHKFVVSFGQGSRETLQDLEKNRVSLQKEFYTGIFIPNVTMNQCREYDETITLVCYYTFVGYFRSTTKILYTFGCSKILHFVKTFNKHRDGKFFIVSNNNLEGGYIAKLVCDNFSECSVCRYNSKRW